jgi:hypothetical protein
MPVCSVCNALCVDESTVVMEVDFPDPGSKQVRGSAPRQNKPKKKLPTQYRAERSWRIRDLSGRYFGLWFRWQDLSFLVGPLP